MITKYDCRLNGVLLSSLDSTICILDIREEPKVRLSAASGFGPGQQLLLRERESLTVQVVFAIHETIITRRTAVIRAIRSWAEKGGTLATSDRPGQQLQVVCSSVPGFSAGDWTEALTLTFTTTRCPYWEDKDNTSYASDSTVTMTAPGTADETPVTAMVVNKGSAAMTRLTLQCGTTRMDFEGISLPAGNMFMLLYSSGNLMATVGGKSVLACRTPDSDDDLLAPCGRAATAYASGDQPLTVTFSVKGRYL